MTACGRFVMACKATIACHAAGSPPSYCPTPRSNKQLHKRTYQAQGLLKVLPYQGLRWGPQG